MWTGYTQSAPSFGEYLQAVSLDTTFMVPNKYFFDMIVGLFRY